MNSHPSLTRFISGIFLSVFQCFSSLERHLQGQGKGGIDNTSSAFYMHIAYIHTNEQSTYCCFHHFNPLSFFFLTVDVLVSQVVPPDHHTERGHLGAISLIAQVATCCQKLTRQSTEPPVRWLGNSPRILWKSCCSIQLKKINFSWTRKQSDHGNKLNAMHSSFKSPPPTHCTYMKLSEQQ